MLLIYITLIAMLAMAKHPRRRRRMGRYLRGAVDESLSMATLASKTLVLAIFDETVNERTLISSLVATWSLRNFTPIANAGPILVGVSHSDYTAAEIEAFIEATGSWNEGNMTQQEIAKRKIRRVGVFDTPDAAEDTAVLNDGKPIKTRLNWILLQGQSLNQWSYNLGSAAFATSTPVVDMSGHANLWPR